jgi:drug/metabolite transporter (DMT)-like permease
MPDSIGRPDERHEPEPTTLAAFNLLVVLAGGSAPAIRYVSCDGCELDPFWGAAIRFAVAGAIFAAVSAWRGRRRGRALAGATLFGALQFGAGFAFVYCGLVHAPAGLTQVLLACVPLFTFALALVQRQERFRLEGLVGAALAAAGIAVVFGSGFDTGVPLSSMLATLAGAVCWAEALVVVKASPGVHPAAMNAVAMAVGAVILLALSVLSDEAHALPEEASTLTAQTYLVFAGSLGVFWLYVFVAAALERECRLVPARLDSACNRGRVRLVAGRIDYARVRRGLGAGPTGRVHRGAEAPRDPDGRRAVSGMIVRSCRALRCGARGGVAERSNAAVSKTVRGR